MTTSANAAPPSGAAAHADSLTDEWPGAPARRCVLRALSHSFSLIIVTKGRPEALRAALRSVACALPANGEVIVVDGDPDRSAADPLAELRLAYPDVAARYLGSEPGMTLQRNKGIDAARGDVVVFIDDDCTVEPDLFEVLARVYGDASVIGATGLILEPDNPRLASSGRLRRLVLGGGRQGTMNRFGFRRPLVDLDTGHDMEFMYGPLMSARRQYAAAVRFDETLGHYALGEDDDFSYRLSRCGRLRYEPTAVVHHHELGRRGMNVREINRMHVVNKTYLFQKNFRATPRARTAFAVLLVMLFVHRVLNREWAGLLGLVEGLKEVHSSHRRARVRRSRLRAVISALARPRFSHRAIAGVALPAIVAALLLAPLAGGVGSRHRDIDRATAYRTHLATAHSTGRAPAHSTANAPRSAAAQHTATPRQRHPDGDDDNNAVEVADLDD